MLRFGDDVYRGGPHQPARAGAFAAGVVAVTRGVSARNGETIRSGRTRLS